MVGVLVVALVRGSIRKLHRDREAVAILWADFGQQLEQFNARNTREPLCGVEEVPLSSRSSRMDERERNGMPDALRVDLPRLLDRMCALLGQSRTGSVSTAEVRFSASVPLRQLE
jgi:hypothetical protein